MGEGRLRYGWKDTTIKDLQQDICTEAVRALQAWAALQQHDAIKQQSAQASQPNKAHVINFPFNYREDYNKDSDGKPCYSWNWERSVGSRCHTTLPKIPCSTYVHGVYIYMMQAMCFC